MTSAPRSTCARGTSAQTGSVEVTMARFGLGRAHVGAASQWSQRRWLAVEVTVHAFNTEATAFYDSVGFAAFVPRMRYQGPRAAESSVRAIPKPTLAKC